jgi:hypothetical protein
LKHSVERRHDEVLNFVTTTDSYTIFVHPRLRLDVARCQNKQLPDQHDGYIWLQAVQGYFVLEQRLDYGKPGPWMVIFEVTPDAYSSSFFGWVDDEFERLLPEWQQLPPLPEPLPEPEEGSPAQLQNNPGGD